MWLVDGNVLLYAVNRSAAHHDASRAWLDSSLQGAVPVGLAWSSLLTFLRVSTHRSAFPAPFTVDEACRQLRSWLSAPAALVVEPTTRHGEVLIGLLEESGTAGNLVPDAHLAALASELAATIVTFDSDFLRFRGVRSQRPGA
jgi:uncharacterized protein